MDRGAVLREGNTGTLQQPSQTQGDPYGSATTQD